MFAALPALCRMVRVEHEYLQQGGENYPPGYFTDSQDNSE